MRGAIFCGNRPIAQSERSKKISFSEGGRSERSKKIACSESGQSERSAQLVHCEQKSLRDRFPYPKRAARRPKTASQDRCKLPKYQHWFNILQMCRAPGKGRNSAQRSQHWNKEIPRLLKEHDLLQPLPQPRGSSSLANTDVLEKFGKQSQSTDPSQETKAAVRQSPIRA